MRVALMAVEAQGGAPVRLAGRPIAWHQLRTLLALGCERVICLADAPAPAVAALQRESEARGAKFHAVAHHRALSGLVSAADTLFVIAPGVLPERGWLLGALGARAGVVVLPADRAVERGFERIDRERAWGGVLATRGDAIEALAALPPDADPIAGLLRVALQRGARSVEVPEPWLDDGRWALIADSSAAARVEGAWQARHVPAPGIERPGEALAHRLARLLLPRAADRPPLAAAVSLAGVGAALAGGAAGYLGHTAAGLAMLTLGALAAQVGARLGAFARAGAGDPSPSRSGEVRDALLDLSLIAIAASPHHFAGWLVPYAAGVLVAALRLVRAQDGPRWLRPLGDRVLVFALLATAAGFGGFVPALGAIGLAGLAGRLLWPAPRG